MRDNIDILGIFHDGYIVEIQHELPNISIRIEIEYLREMFPSKGSSFIANIIGCESIEFLKWESEVRTSDLKSIASEEPEILSVEQIGNSAHIICTEGELDILYSNIEFQLDNGEIVTYQELEDACKKYWHNFGNSSSS